MGYVPPAAPATLYTLATVFDVGARLLRPTGWHQSPGLPRSYEEYRRQLYGEPGRDWLPALNFAALVCGVALVVSTVIATA